MRSMILALVAVGLVGAFVWALLPAPIQVDLVSVQKGPMQVTVLAEGTTRIREKWQVTAPVGGRILRAPVQVGERVVAQKTIVAIIEPAEPPFLDARTRRLAEAAVAEAKAAVRLAEVNLERAEVELGHLQKELERYAALALRGTVSDMVLQDAKQAELLAKAAREVALSNLDLQRATLLRAEAQLEGPSSGSGETDVAGCCIRLVAPQSGVVLELTDQNARLVQAGEKLMTIGDPADLEIRADLLSSDAVAVQEGAQASVDRWGGEGVLAAQVRQIDPSAFTRISALGIEEQRVPVVLDLLTPAEERVGLGDQFRVHVALVVWQADEVVQVPQSALFRSAGDWALFVEREGQASLRRVEVGRIAGEWAQVLAGVEPGEKVVAYPSSAIEEGTRLEVRDGG